jgi:hypothetical protein
VSQDGDCYLLPQEKQKLEYLQDLPEKMKLYSQSGEEAMVCRGQGKGEGDGDDKVAFIPGSELPAHSSLTCNICLIPNAWMRSQPEGLPVPL